MIENKNFGVRPNSTDFRPLNGYITTAIFYTNKKKIDKQNNINKK